MAKQTLDPLGETESIETVDDSAQPNDQIVALQFAHEQLLERISDLESSVSELTSERDDLKKQLAQLNPEDDGTSPRRMIADFRVCGAFGYFNVKSGEVVSDPDHIAILTKHNAPMVRA